MNILFIHETEYIEKMIFEYQIIPEILSSRRHNVFVIDFPTHWANDGKKSKLFTQSEVIKNVSRAKKPGTITLIRPAFIRIPVLSRLSAFFSYFNLIDTVIREHQIDVIVLFAAPTNGLQALYAASKNGIPVYFRLLDVLHRLVPSTLLQWPAYLIEKIIYKRVDRMTAITPRLCQYGVKMGANPEASRYLPSGSDADLFFYQQKDPTLMAKYGLKPSDLVLLFAGTLYNFSGLDKVISALPGQLQDRPDIKLLIVGAGEQENKLKRIVSDMGLQKTVLFTGFISYPELPRYINLADICINPFEINETTNIIFPGKIYQYLACEKTVLATKLEGMLDIFPIDHLDSGIFYYDTVSEFFDLVKKINRRRVTDINPSLQQITTEIEEELRLLSAAKKGAIT